MRAFMNLEEKKLELVKLILDVDEPIILAQVESILLERDKVDWWDTLSQQEKETIKRGLKDMEDGNTIPHEKVMREARSKYLKE